VLADRADSLMAEYGVAPTPNNFAVWFGYAGGTPPEPKRLIDVMIATATATATADRRSDGCADAGRRRLTANTVSLSAWYGRR